MLLGHTLIIDGLRDPRSPPMIWCPTREVKWISAGFRLWGLPMAGTKFIQPFVRLPNGHSKRGFGR